MDNAAVVSNLTDEECFERLSAHELGRLVTQAAGVLDIFPVNYALDGRSIVFRTAEGSKLTELVINDEVLFEVDDHTADEAWSVVIRGHAQRLETSDEVQAADELPLTPWIPTLKYNYVRVTPDSLSGRWFRRGPEPDRYGIQQY
jgi:nitroimidazol reductase NimA-like FMN-containing flavoprotein (pyridoxamine 5'-phosphate oxidase superfamily)